MKTQGIHESSFEIHSTKSLVDEKCQGLRYFFQLHSFIQSTFWLCFTDCNNKMLKLSYRWNRGLGKEEESTSILTHERKLDTSLVIIYEYGSLVSTSLRFSSISGEVPVERRPLTSRSTLQVVILFSFCSWIRSKSKKGEYILWCLWSLFRKYIFQVLTSFSSRTGSVYERSEDNLENSNPYTFFAIDWKAIIFFLGSWGPLVEKKNCWDFQSTMTTT